MKKLLLLLIFILSITAYGGRFYSSEYGRWVNRDPIGVDGGINTYNSVSNNMVNGFSGGLSYSSGMTHDRQMPNYLGEITNNFWLDPWGFFTFEEAKGIIKDKAVIEGFKALLKASNYVDSYQQHYDNELLNTGRNNNIPGVIGPIANSYPIEYNYRTKKWDRVRDPLRQPIEHIADFFKMGNSFKMGNIIKGQSSNSVQGFKADPKCFFYAHTHPLGRHQRIVNRKEGFFFSVNGRLVSNLEKLGAETQSSPADRTATANIKKSNFIVHPVQIIFIEYKDGKALPDKAMPGATWQILGYPNARAMYLDLGPLRPTKK